MRTVGQLLESKGYDIWSVAPDDSVLDALKLMADKNVGAVLVLAAGSLAGSYRSGISPERSPSKA